MAMFKPYRVSSNKLNDLPIKDGQFIITTDSAQIYFDNGNTRVKTGIETDPTVPSHVKAISENDITNWNNKQSALSTNQIAATNSGITATKVSTYDNYADTIANKANDADLATVAKTGKYDDLSGKPTNVSSFNNDSGYITTSGTAATAKKTSGTLTIQKNGSNIKTFNGSEDITANVTVPTKVSELSNDSSFITSTVDNLTNYYTKTNVYTKSEINNMVNGISSLDIQVVDNLPTSDISASTFYLLPKETEETNNIYDEYIYVSGKWELIGTTKVDLSDYVKNGDLATVAKTGKYSDLSGTPTELSSFTNDSGYITSSGKSATATKLATARTVTIGSTGKTFDGSENVSWTLDEIGAAATSHTHSYAPISHASSATTYGIGTASNYGHIKLSDTYTSSVSSGAAANGLGASQNALYNAYNTLNTEKAASTHSHSSATESTAGFMASTDKSKLDYTNIAYCTCSTAAGTSAKVATIDGNSNFTLQKGAIAIIRFTVSNTASSCTLNVGNTGAKSIYANTSVYTGNGSQYCGLADRTSIYVYDGTYWVWISDGYDRDTNIIPSVYCNTAAATAAKIGMCTNYSLLSKSHLQVLLTTANTSASALTLNINGKGAKPIYINGSASSSSNYTLPAGTYFVYYNGTNYYFRTDGKLTGDLEGTAIKASETAGTLTIQKNGTNVKTFNGSGSVTANITVPTKTSELTNDSGYITSSDLTGSNDPSYMIATSSSGISPQSTDSADIIPMDTEVLKNGDDFKLSNSGIVIGSDVSTIECSGLLQGIGFNQGESFFAYIMRNDEAVSAFYTVCAGDMIAVACPPKIIKVSKDDVIKLAVLCPDSTWCSIRGGEMYTYLQVKKIA